MSGIVPFPPRDWADLRRWAVERALQLAAVRGTWCSEPADVDQIVEDARVLAAFVLTGDAASALAEQEWDLSRLEGRDALESALQRRAAENAAMRAREDDAA